MVDFGLQGAIALITGGASGIGFACARWMAERGCRVVIADRDTGSADAAAQAVYGTACTDELRGTYVMCAAVGPRMATRRCGSIVNIGSVAALRSSPLHAYGPAKAAVIALTESLAVEWGRSGVRVNTVSPGFTRTPAVAKSLERGILN